MTVYATIYGTIGFLVVFMFGCSRWANQARIYLRINGNWNAVKKYERKSDELDYAYLHLYYEQFYPKEAPDYSKFFVEITKSRALRVLGIKWAWIYFLQTIKTLSITFVYGTDRIVQSYGIVLKITTFAYVVVPTIILMIYGIGIRCKLRVAKRKERKNANADILLCDDSNIHSELHLHPETGKRQLGDNQKCICKTKISKQPISKKEKKEKKIASTTRPAPYILIRPSADVSKGAMVFVILLSGFGIYLLHIGDVEDAFKISFLLIPLMILSIYPLLYTVTIYRNEVYRTIFFKFTKRWTLDDIAYFSVRCIRSSYGTTPIIFVHMKGHIFWSFYVNSDHFGYDLFWHSIRSSNKNRIIDVPIRGEHKIEDIDFWKGF